MSKSSSQVYQVRLLADHRQVVTGFHYPPWDDYVPEDNERKIAEGDYAVLGTSHEWQTHSAFEAAKIAKAIDGFVEIHTVED